MSEASANKKESVEVQSLNAATAPVETDKRVPVLVAVDDKIYEIKVPVDDVFKECRQKVADAHKERIEERDAAATAADDRRKATSADASAYAKTLGDAIDDCEALVAALRKPRAEFAGSQLSCLSGIVSVHYAEWASAQASASKTATEVSGAKAPLYILRMTRRYDGESTTKLNAWDTEAQVIDLHKNDLKKMYAATDIEAFESFGMHKHAQRVLLLERPFCTADGTLVVLSYTFVFAIREHLRAEILAAAAVADGFSAPAATPPTPPALPQDTKTFDVDDTIGLRTFIQCAMIVRTDGKTKTKKERDAAIARCNGRMDAGRELWAEQRYDTRLARLSAQLPGLTACAVAILSKQLATHYDPTGVKVPPETLVARLTCFNGLLIANECHLQSHSQLRANIDELDKMIDQTSKKILAERPSENEAGPNEQALRLHYTDLVKEIKTLRSLDALAFRANTREELLFAIDGTEQGLDADQPIQVHFIQRINVRRLMHTHKLATDKTKAEEEEESATLQAPQAPELESVTRQAPQAPELKNKDQAVPHA